MVHAFCVLPKKSLPNLRQENFLLCFLLEVLRLYINFCDPLVCVCVCVCVCVYGCITVLVSFFERISLSTLDDFGIFVENELTTYVRICFWTLSMTPYVWKYMMVWLCAKSNHLDYCSFAVSLAIKYYEISNNLSF